MAVNNSIKVELKKTRIWHTDMSDEYVYQWVDEYGDKYSKEEFEAMCDSNSIVKIDDTHALIYR